MLHDIVGSILGWEFSRTLGVHAMGAAEGIVQVLCPHEQQAGSLGWVCAHGCCSAIARGEEGGVCPAGLSPNTSTGWLLSQEPCAVAAAGHFCCG